MVRCDKCQSDVPQIAKYCWNCGTPVGRSISEEFAINADELVKKVKDLVHEGNVTKIIVRDEQGNLLLELPVTAGLIGAVMAPWLAALGAMAALVTRCNVTVERRD